MKTLTFRLWLTVGAGTLLSIVLTDLLYLSWTAPLVRTKVHASLYASLHELLATESRETFARDRLYRITQSHRTAFAVWRNDGHVRRTASFPVTSEVWGAGLDPVRSRGYEVLSVRLGAEHHPWTRVVVAQSVQEMSRGLLALNTRWLWALAGVAFVSMAVTTWMLQRSFGRAFGRLAELVESSGVEQADRPARDFGDISRAIIALTQSLRDERAALETQLEALGEAHASLGEAQAQLVRSERLAVVGQLAAGVAHEIGNPLTVISGSCELLGDPGLSDEERGSLSRRLGSEVERMRETIRSLLDLSRSGRQDEGPGDLAEACRHVEGLARGIEKLRGVTVEFQIGSASLSTGLATQSWVQILLNLLMNAGDALEGEGAVKVRAYCEDDDIVLAVDDDGPGFNEEVAARVFQPFFSTKGAGKGTGLGLSVCENMLLQAGGSLAVVESTLGGASFRATAPRASQPQA